MASASTSENQQLDVEHLIYEDQMWRHHIQQNLQKLLFVYALVICAFFYL